MLGVDTNAWTQRGYRHEIALAFGLERPAFQNQYGELDLFSTMLTIWIACVLRYRQKGRKGETRNRILELMWIGAGVTLLQVAAVRL